MLNAHIDDVRTFVSVVEAGSVSAAARELHLTQSAVTRRVQRLERAIGADLIDRRHRPFTLTTTGVRAAEHCRRMLSDVNHLRALSAYGTNIAGEARLGVAHALTELALAQSLDTVRLAWPTIEWRVRTGWSQDLIARVETGALDAACVLLPDDQRVPRGVRGDRLALEEILVVAARADADNLRTPHDLGTRGWIVNPEGCAARARVRRALSRSGFPFHISVEAYDYELQMALVARGRGVGLVPRRLLERSRSRSQLAPVKVRGFAFPFAIWVVTPDAAGHLAKPLRAVRDALVAELRGREASGGSQPTRGRTPAAVN
ncbi:MAG: LysR family transcriptional regulator [Vicinamibacterales bacterium]